MGQYPESEPLTAQQKVNMAEKAARLAEVLTLFWEHHGYPSTGAEGITQANVLYAQLYPNKCSTEA